MNKSSIVFDLSKMTVDLASTQESISFICKVEMISHRIIFGAKAEVIFSGSTSVATPRN